MVDKVFRQNEAMIGLLARQTLGVPIIYAIVTKAKKNPGSYVDVYNSLRGDLTVSGAAKMAKVKGPTMSVILSSWEAQGIVYDIGEEKKPQYVRLLKLPKKQPSN